MMCSFMLVKDSSLFQERVMNMVASDHQEDLAGPASSFAIKPAESTAMSGIIHSSSNSDSELLVEKSYP